MNDDALSLYLARLGLSGVALSPDGLTALQRAHLAAIPFESIDPFLGRTPELAPDALADKILRGGRGGYCYEQNTLYDDALRNLGFTTRRVLARVRQRRPEPGPRSHLALIVTLDGAEWLADTGFGGPGPREPLPLEPGVHEVTNGRYRFTRDATLDETVLERHEAEGWQPLYSFDRAHVTDAEIAAANHVSSTWAQSPFPANLMLAGWDGDTRLGLFNRALTEEGAGERRGATLTEKGDLAALFARLGLSIDAETTERIWDRLP